MAQERKPVGEIQVLHVCVVAVPEDLGEEVLQTRVAWRVLHGATRCSSRVL
jgi:hypothetical protein